MNGLRVNEKRLWDDMMAIAAITDPERPYTRRSFSKRFIEGREWLTRRFEEAGLSVRLDAGANLIGRREGSEPNSKSIMLGSHSDTVPAGGRFDGVAGVIVALEVARTLQEAGGGLRHPVEVVDFLAEEPSEYGLSCVGSRAMAGALDEKMLAYTNPVGERLSVALARVGGDAAKIDRARRRDILGFLELHIEQGAVLQNRKIELGLVTAIAGIVRIEIVFEGAADHAGTTPMDDRRDAAVAAAQMTVFVSASANEYAVKGKGHFVATTGILEIQPNAANVVPQRARIILDIRGEDTDVMAEYVGRIEAESASIARRINVHRARFEILSRTSPTICDTHLRGLLAQGAASLGYSAMNLASGAGHDAAFIARIAPSAMLFVPCRDGRSHTPEEWAEPKALANGANTLTAAVRLLDQRD
jgi:N-carbamoyl-L-amino-acid hydrolase